MEAGECPIEKSSGTHLCGTGGRARPFPRPRTPAPRTTSGQRMRERAQVHAQPSRSPFVAPGGKAPALGLFAIAESQQPAPQVDALPVHSGIHDQRGRVDLGRDGECAPLEAIDHDAIDRAAQRAEVELMLDRLAKHPAIMLLNQN